MKKLSLFYTEHRRLLTVASLSIIIGTGAVLRLMNLPQSGILRMDEGGYLLDSHARFTEFKLYASLVSRKFDEILGGPELILSVEAPEILEKLSETWMNWPKVGYYWFVAVAEAIFGFRTWSGSLVEGIFGTATLLLLYSYVRALFNKRAALIAVLLLSLFAYHVHASRNAFSLATPAFFGLLSFYAHARWQRHTDCCWWLLLAGCAAGWGFLAAYHVGALIVYLGIVHAISTLWMRPHWKWNQRLSRFMCGALLMMAGFIGMQVLAEATSYPMILLARAQGLHYPHRTYLEALAPCLSWHSAHGFDLVGLALFPLFLFIYEGIGIFLLGFGVLFVAACALRQKGSIAKTRRVLNWLYVVGPLLFGYVLFGIKGQIIPRPYTVLLPYLACLIALLFETAWRKARFRPVMVRVLLSVLLVFSVGCSLYKSIGLARSQNAYPQVLSYLQSQGVNTVWAPYGLVLTCYLMESGMDGGVLPVASLTIDGLYTHVIADFTGMHGGVYPDELVLPPSGASEPVLFQHNLSRTLLIIESWQTNYGRQLSACEAIARSLALDFERASCVYLYDLRSSE